MSDPPTPSDADIPDRGLGLPPSREGRPGGEAGGHTVQDWEQPPPGRRATLSDPVLVEETSPPTTPLYLRPQPKGGATAEPAFDAPTQTLTAQTGAFIDALTRGLADALAEAMRPIVTESVSRLLPMLLSLGSVPDGEGAAAPVDSPPGPAVA